MEDGAGEVWLIDPNFRLNGSTPFFLLGDYLDHPPPPAPALTTGYFCYPGPPVELFDRFRQEIDRRELLPIGAHYDPREDGITPHLRGGGQRRRPPGPRRAAARLRRQAPPLGNRSVSQVFDVHAFELSRGPIPVLLELPHGGHLTPDEVKSYLHPKFTPGDRREDSDEFSDELYLDLPAAPHVLRFMIWRAHADPNRPCDDLDADGTVKTLTSQGVKIYQSDRGLPAAVRQQVIDRYIRPHRRRLAELVASPAIEKVVFCHTMPGIGTRSSAGQG